eukprot:301182_1
MAASNIKLFHYNAPTPPSTPTYQLSRFHSNESPITSPCEIKPHQILTALDILSDHKKYPSPTAPNIDTSNIINLCPRDSEAINYDNYLQQRPFKETIYSKQEKVSYDG